MDKLDERQVQTWALHYLHSRYEGESRFEGLPFYADAELNVKKTEGEIWVGRADGFICIKLQENNFYTIALEAKSFKTKNDLLKFLRKNENEISNLQNVISASILFVPALFVMVVLWHLAWYWILLGTVIVLGISGVIASFYEKRPSFYKTNVHIQLETYPANERWIAVPDDTWNLLKDSAVSKRFKGICKSYKFGLLVVNRDGAVAEVSNTTKIKGEYLDNYVRSDMVKESFISKTNKKISYHKCLEFLRGMEIKSIECSNPKSKVFVPKL